MLMKCVTPSWAGADETAHGSGSAPLLGWRRGMPCLLLWLRRSATHRRGVWPFGASVWHRLFLFKAPLLSRKRRCCLPRGVSTPRC